MEGVVASLGWPWFGWWFGLGLGLGPGSPACLPSELEPALQPGWQRVRRHAAVCVEVQCDAMPCDATRLDAVRREGELRVVFLVFGGGMFSQIENPGWAPSPGRRGRIDWGVGRGCARVTLGKRAGYLVMGQRWYVTTM